jgi:hypothetical protein
MGELAQHFLAIAAFFLGSAAIGAAVLTRMRRRRERREMRRHIQAIEPVSWRQAELYSIARRRPK